MFNVIIFRVLEPETRSQWIEFVTDSPERTHQFGSQIGKLIKPGDVICLAGTLGAGKTTLAAGIGHGWGAAEVVNSPTFVFVNVYSRATGGRLYHVDAYRLGLAQRRNTAEAESIGLPEILGDEQSSILIEWPERVETYLPAERLWIELQWEAEWMRRVKVEARGERYIELLSLLSNP